MSNVDVSKIPGAVFYPFSKLFPNIADNEFASEQRSVLAQNQQGAGQFTFYCNQWAHDAAIARAAGSPLPPKPISPPSRVVLKQDDPEKGGTWIVQTEGPLYGVCPDLPPINPSTSNVTGLVTKDTPVQPTQDQKLDSIAATCAAILAALAKAGVA